MLLQLLNDYTCLFLFGSLFLLLMLGVPITHAMGISGMVFAFFFWSKGSLYALLSSTISTMMSWSLFAVPLFTFMALVLFKTGIVEDMYDSLYRFTCGLKGGLAICTIIVGALMGAMTGVVAGTVVALSTIALPQMLKYGYKKEIAIGSVLSGGTLGQLIPPSTIMIMYGTMTGVSVGQLFAGGISSGILLAVLYIIWILIYCYIIRPSSCPTVPKKDRFTLKENLKHALPIFPPLILVVLVLGSIFAGIATPTEAASVGCVGALAIAMFNKRLKWKPFKEACSETLRMTAMVGYITLAASFFGQVFIATGGKLFVTKMASSLPFVNFGLMLILMAIIFVLGMFIDTVAIVVICAPIFVPIVQIAGFDPLWFALCFVVCIQCAYLTPPFGFSLFYMKGVAPEGINLANIYKSSIPFIAVQIIGLLLCILFPALATWGVSVFM
ncbi:MAG: TRAP transporter large permease subunit [Oscillospiraceae bacterium]|nr:TRAP transporter large permease subunit [Oscillospiraceae bacterium]